MPKYTRAKMFANLTETYKAAVKRATDSWERYGKMEDYLLGKTAAYAEALRVIGMSDEKVYEVQQEAYAEYDAEKAK